MTARQHAPSGEAEPLESGGHRPNDVIAGKYLLRGILGVGGMGTVWAATNLDLDLDVAVKVVNKELCSDETRARLATEARAEAKVQHRGIVRVLDLGVTDEGEPFLVMERLEGRSLGALLDEVGHLESIEAVRLMLPILDALAYAHERGIVHRDLKPDNVFLAEQRGRMQPKLVDFGIAKLEDMPVDRRQTGRGAVVGSPGYMAPEHARGAEVDYRADIFCAALVLYEAISGRSAFRGSNYNELLRAVIEQDLAPITAYGRGDAVLSRILVRALAKQPAHRQASCRELGRDLARWLVSQGETEDITGEPLATWFDEADDVGSARKSLALVRPPRGRASSSGGKGLGSIRAVSLSSPEIQPRRRSSLKRYAFAALAVAGFAGGLIATRAFDAFPTKTLMPAAPNAASTAPAKPEEATSAPGPRVTPVENDAARSPLSTDTDSHPIRAAAPPRDDQGAARARPSFTASPKPRTTETPSLPSQPALSFLPKPPPSFGDDVPVPPPPAAAAEHAPAPNPALTLPPDPPPPRPASHPSGDEGELKDPYK